MQPTAAAPHKTLLVLDYTTNWYANFKGTKVGDFVVKVRCFDQFLIVMIRKRWSKRNGRISMWKLHLMVKLESSSKRLRNPSPLARKRRIEWSLQTLSWSETFRAISMTTPLGTWSWDLLSTSILRFSFLTLLLHNPTFIIIRIPGCNSVESVLRCMDRPMVYAELLAIERSDVGRASGFRVVPMTYYANLKVQQRSRVCVWYLTLKFNKKKRLAHSDSFLRLILQCWKVESTNLFFFFMNSSSFFFSCKHACWLWKGAGARRVLIQGRRFNSSFAQWLLHGWTIRETRVCEQELLHGVLMDRQKIWVSYSKDWKPLSRIPS